MDISTAQQANISYACQRAAKTHSYPRREGRYPRRKTSTPIQTMRPLGRKFYYTTDGSTPSPGVGYNQRKRNNIRFVIYASFYCYSQNDRHCPRLRRQSPMTSTTYTVK